MEIHYLNTDLDLASSNNLSALSKRLQKVGLHALNDPQFANSRWHVNLETNKRFKGPAACIAAILAAVEKLDGAALLQWQLCTLRECNIGVTGGDAPTSVCYKLPAELLSRLTNAGLSLGVTIYAPDKM